MTMDIDIFQIPAILRRRWHYIALSCVVFAALALVFSLKLQSVYVATAQILLDPKSLTSNLSGNQQAALAQPDPANLDSQIYVVESSTVLLPVIEKLGLDKDPYFRTKTPPNTVQDATATLPLLIKHLKVAREGQSLILTITADHPVAVTASEIANDIAASYLKQIDSARMDAARRASAAFQAQASDLRDKVLKAETAVENFRASNGLATTGTTGLVIDQQLSGLNQQLIAARGAEEQQKAIYDQTRSMTVSAIESGAIPETGQSSTISLLRDRYVQLLDRQAEAATNLGANHPQMKAIDSQVASMRQALQQELDRVRQSVKSSYERAVANRKALEAQMQSLTKSSFASGERQIQLRQLESQADAVRSIYKAFLSRSEELGQEETIALNNSRVITPATTALKSVTLLKGLVMVAALMFGLAFGSVLAVLREMLSQRRTVNPRIHPPVIASPSGQSLPEGSAPTQTASPHPITDITDLRHMPPSDDLFLIAGPSPSDAKQKPGRSGFVGGLMRGLTRPLAQPSSTPLLDRTKLAADTARFLVDCAAQTERLTVLFAAAGAPFQPNGFIADLAGTLMERGHGVLLADGRLNTGLKPRKPGQRPSLSLALDWTDADEAPLASLIRYQRLAFSSHRPDHGQTTKDFVLIDACGTAIAERLDDLAAGCDLIVVLTTGTAGDRTAISTLLQQLGEFADKAVGKVHLGAAG
ncbi:GumC family protein [Allorhizobium sp. BGMRC 0089]|uniref:GumC family protein n=1 Tax=Allorhizobium sonneratiae TaxID=2934936 RepID=UPI0020339BA3|nr:GumC family protein [Allorhizobium sonneratiae]MCM2294736.1 GumC family protein [Allorhizobium sonneratiae]